MRNTADPRITLHYTMDPSIRRSFVKTAVVYDIEIIRGPRPLLVQGVTREEELGIETKIEYCDGWDDHANMGISVLCALDLNTGQPRVFLGDNLDLFAEWVQNRNLVGFNSLRFDDKVCAANDVEVRTSFDVLQWIWASMGLDVERYDRRTHSGVGLSAMAKANGFPPKSMASGAQAAIQWQLGFRGSVIDYCLQDVWITAQLYLHALAYGSLKLPERVADRVGKRHLAMPITHLDKAGSSRRSP